MKMQELNLAEMTEITGGGHHRGSTTIIKVYGYGNTVVGTQNGFINIGSVNIFGL